MAPRQTLGLQCVFLHQIAKEDRNIYRKRNILRHVVITKDLSEIYMTLDYTLISRLESVSVSDDNDVWSRV